MVSILGFRSLPEVLMFSTSLLVGLSMVMGSNAINAAPSFMLEYYKYVDGSADATTHRPTFWKNVLTFYTVITLVSQAIHEPTNLTTFMCRFSLLFRLEVAAAGMILELLVVMLVPRGPGGEVGAIVALMIMAYVGGASRAYFENTGYALFAPCPTKMISGMLIGSPLSGALMSVLQIILKASMPDTFDSIFAQSAIYFSISIGIIFAAAVLLALLLVNPYAQRYVSEFRSRRNPFRNIYRPLDHERRQQLASDVPLENADMLFDDRVRDTALEPVREGDVDGGGLSLQDHSSEEEEREGEEVVGAGVVKPSTGSVMDSVLEEGKEEPLTTAELLQEAALWPVIKKIYPMLISCFLSFGVTYLVYPGVMLAVDPDDGWYTTLNVAVFNLCDLAGRIFCMWKRAWPPRWFIVVGSIVRILLFPYLFLCAVHIIPTQAAAYVGTAVLAVTTGYFGTLSMVYGSDTPSLASAAERALAGQAGGVCLLLGCAIGSLLQLAVVLPL